MSRLHPPAARAPARPDPTGATYGSLEFDDFDEFRASLRGWDTEAVQISPGRLQLRHTHLSTSELSVLRLQSNQRVADGCSTVREGITLVLALGRKRCCGVDVAPGSLVVLTSGREYQNVLEAGWESIEILVSEALLQETELPWENREKELAPERCVLPISAARVAAVRAWAGELLALPSGGPPEATWRDLVAVRADRAREDVVTSVLPALLSGWARRGDVRRNGRERRTRETLVRDALELARPDGPQPSVGHLAAELGVSRRTLELSFRGLLGCSPSRFLRIRRLERVRRDLLRGRSVTDAAVANDFVSLGRLSEHYRRHFGELPSETLAGSRPRRAGSGVSCSGDRSSRFAGGAPSPRPASASRS